MAKAVIFDIDGTLLDSVDFHAHAWVEAFRDYGHDVEFQAVRDQIGKGGDQLMPVFLSPSEIDAQGKVLQERQSEIFKERYLPKVMAFPEVRGLFQRLLEHGIQVALASSAAGDELETYKQIAGIEDLIDVETSSDDADKSKPHPDIFEAAIQQLGGVPRASIYVVGDTPYDAEAARKAGVRTIGVTCGGWSEDELKRSGCTEVYEDPADLLDRYDESPLAGK
jgi:phosphoglycolate phosphatase-like HAD superfamily hydrolase